MSERQSNGEIHAGVAAPLPAGSPPPPRISPFTFHLLLHLLFLSSIIYLFLLPYPFLSQRIYTDENAWLAGNAADRLTSSHIQLAHTFHRRFASSPGPSRRLLLTEQWQNMGLDVHPWTFLHPPNSRWEGEETAVTVGVVDARLGDGKESVALVVDYDTAISSPSFLAISGPALLTGLASYLASVPWLARDHLLIAVEHSNDKARAIEALGGWLHYYRSPPLNASYTLTPFHRSGSILSALCLDLPLVNDSGAFSSFTLHAGGRYGLSPNLDVVSVALGVMRDRGVKVGVAGGGVWKGRREWWAQGFDDEYAGLIRSAVHHITGEATSYHGHFIHHNIDALTIAALPPSAGPDASGALMLSLDAYCHALNNLIEKLHHSTWLYLLLSSTRFVTMSKYVYAAALLLAPIILKAIYQLTTPPSNWVGDGLTAATLYTACLLPILIAKAVPAKVYLSLSPTLTLISLLLSMAVSVVMMKRGGDGRTLHGVVLVVTFLVLTPLVILNFPLAIAMGLLCTPLVFSVERGGGGWKGWGRRLWGGLWLVGASPLTVFGLYCTYWGIRKWEQWVEVVEGVVYGDHLLYWLIFGVYLPLYYVSWARLLSTEERKETPSAMDKKVQ